MIIFLYGKNTYAQEKYLKDIKKKFTDEVDQSGLNISTIDGEKVAAAELQQEVYASGFMADKRLIIIKNIFKNKKSEIEKSLNTILEKDKENTNILVFLESEKKNSKLFKSFAKTPLANEFSEIQQNELGRVILHRVKEKGGNIEPEIASYLASLVTTDEWQLSHDLDKLLAYGKGTITRDGIDALITPVIHDNIFALIDAIATQNKKEALKLLEQQFLLDNEPMYLLSMIIRQFRILIQIRTILDEKGSIDSAELAKLLNIHPFVAKKSLSQAQRFNLSYLQAIYRYLVKLDDQFKTSYANPRLLLEEFVVKI